VNRLAAMEAFIRVVDTGSFSGAARLLRVGQPAVSKAIARPLMSNGWAASAGGFPATARKTERAHASTRTV
jgi:hypothetical protein